LAFSYAFTLFIAFSVWLFKACGLIIFLSLWLFYFYRWLFRFFMGSFLEIAACSRPQTQPNNGVKLTAYRRDFQPQLAGEGFNKCTIPC
jgi:hypothetical protein